MYSTKAKLCCSSLSPSNNLFSMHFLLSNMFLLQRTYKGKASHLWLIMFKIKIQDKYELDIHIPIK